VFLRHWHQHKVSLSTARGEWVKQHKSTGRVGCLVANFSREEDRHAMCAYAVTGQFLLPPVPGVVSSPVSAFGSICMFGLPPEFSNYRLEGGESLLSCIPVDELGAYIAAMEEQRGVGLDLTVTVLSAAVSLLLEGIATLQQHVLAGHITISCQHATLGSATPAQRRFVESLVQLYKPNSMSWSNVHDYMHPAANFHRLARSCSSTSHTTTHYLYSMNWPIDVKGAMVLDYPLVSERKSILLEGKALAKKLGEKLGAEHRWLVSPPVDNCINLANLSLAEKCSSIYSKHFLRGQKLLRKKTELSVYCPYSHAGPLIFMELQYAEL
jgi:hypothetical protein